MSNKHSGQKWSRAVVLRCALKGSAIDMAIGTEALKFAAWNHPAFWDGESDEGAPNVKVTDARTFAKEVVLAINDEAEDGSTLLTRMLDEAIRNAVERGCDGVEVLEQPGMVKLQPNT